jgi:hypothetical protein
MVSILKGNGELRIQKARMKDGKKSGSGGLWPPMAAAKFAVLFIAPDSLAGTKEF